MCGRRRARTSEPGAGRFHRGVRAALGREFLDVVESLHVKRRWSQTACWTMSGGIC